MASSAGKSQGLGIDNFSFSATSQPVLTPVPVSAQVTGSQLVLSWPGLIGQQYQLQYKTNLTDPAWLPLNAPFTGTGAAISVTNSIGGGAGLFYRLAVSPP